jgi:hypothetical protein
MPDDVIAEQQKKIVATQFDGYESDRIDSMFEAIESNATERLQETNEDG